MALVVIMSTISTYLAGMRVIRLRAMANDHRDAIYHADRLLSTVKDAETGQRGFVITGDESYLEPYEAALRQIEGEIDQLQAQRKVVTPAFDLPSIGQL